MNPVVSSACFFTGGVFECDNAHLRSVAVLCVLYKSGVTLCTIFMVLYLSRMCKCGLHVVLLSHTGILMVLLASEPRSTAALLFHSECLSGTILLTLYSMV